MGVTPECIAAVVKAAGGRMSDADAAELIRHAEAVRAAEVAKGNIDNLDVRVRAQMAAGADRTRVSAALRERHAALTEIAYHQGLLDHAALRRQGLSYRNAAITMLEGTSRNAEGGRASVDAGAMAYQTRFMEPIDRLFVTDPEVVRRLPDKDFNRNVVLEMTELREGGKPVALPEPDERRDGSGSPLPAPIIGIG